MDFRCLYLTFLKAFLISASYQITKSHNLKKAELVTMYKKKKRAAFPAYPLSEDHGLSSGTSTDPLDRNTCELFNVLDVFSGVLGKILV
jgi:hypothetical protein